MTRRPRSESNYRPGNSTTPPPEAATIRGRQTAADAELLFSPPILTDTANAQARLARSEEQLRLMFNEMMSAVALHEIIRDEGGKPIDYRFIDVNPMFEKMTGLRREDLIGKTVLEVMPPAERYWIEHYYGRVARTGVHEHFESYAASLGRYYEVRAYCPEPEKFAVIYNDVTERKRAEQSIRESELRYRLVIEQTIEGVFIVDVHTKRILEANRAFCAMLGYTLAELQAKPYYTIIAGNFEDVNANIYHMIDSGLPMTGERQYIAKDGRLVDAEFSASILEMSGKRMLVMVVRDMTDRKKMEEARSRIEKMESLGIMAGGIAHDFNNLLHVVLGQTAMALEDVRQDTAAAGHLEKAKLAVMRAAELTQKLLAYSGMGSIATETVNLNDVIRENLPSLQSALPAGARLVLRLDDTLRMIRGDRQHMQQVVMNLVINAGEAMGEKGGTVTLTTMMEEVFAWETAWTEHTGEPLDAGYYAVLEVKDDGCGMTRETSSKLFDPFFSTKFSGRGLGLAAVYGIVRGHRGGLMLESEEGKGATFRLAFPAIDAAREEPMSEGVSGSIQAAAGFVLVVDDEELVREVVSDLLDTSGFKCITASGGEEALALYAERKGEISVVLLDLTMPGVSGEETFRRLKAIDPKANIVLSSGYSESEVRAKFSELGTVSGFIQKPYQSGALIDKLSPYFAKK